MYTVFLVIHVLIAIALIALILLQQGKGADMGAAFGSGASATMFGARGSASFLSRVTASLATGFFITSMILAYFASQLSSPTSIMERVPAPLSEPASPPAIEPPAIAPSISPSPNPVEIPQVPSVPSQ